MTPRLTTVSAFHATTRPAPRSTPPSIWVDRMAGAEAANRRAKRRGHGGEPPGREEHRDGQDDRGGEPEAEAQREGRARGRPEQRRVPRDGVRGRRRHAERRDRVHAEPQHDEGLDRAAGRGAEHLPGDGAQRDDRPRAELPREEGDRERTHAGERTAGGPRPGLPTRVRRLSARLAATGSSPETRKPSRPFCFTR